MAEPRSSFADLEHKFSNILRVITNNTAVQYRHCEQHGARREWRGADVRITSDFGPEAPKSFMDHDLIVRTYHAATLTWLFLELRDAFGDFLDAGNKYGFYGSLARAALDHLAAHQPESDDPRPLLRAVLVVAERHLAGLQEHGFIPDNAMAVLHTMDAEGRQRRTDLATGEEADVAPPPAKVPSSTPACVFVYGSNLDEVTLNNRCHSARFICIAELPEHALMFTRGSKARGCGVADAVPTPGRSVWGAVFFIAPNDLVRLDACEGYREGRPLESNAYNRTVMEVHPDGDRSESDSVWVYVANRETNPPLPNAAYKKLIVDGARRWGLPDAYQAELAAIRTSD
jgi:gamma-glutamylcyclotransferase (GGCT)/AIG2-like uncharacterized protein YtfP